MELSARAAYRGQVTKIVKSALDFLRDPSSQIVDDNLQNFDEIEEELVSLSQRLTSANANLNAINEDVKQKGLLKPDDSLEKIVDYQDQAINALSRLSMRLEKLHLKQNPVPAALGIADSAITTRPTANGSKLPKLPLKRFDGNYNDWLPFWEQFRCAVHENVSLSPTEKFNYLESVLTGDAKKSIAGFTPSEKCYEAAIALLQEQFGSTEKLIDKHIHQLVSLSPIREQTDVAGLRNLYGTVVSCTRSLTALQVPTSHYYVMLKSILLRCLPTALRIEYHRQEEQVEHLQETVHSSSRSESSLSQIEGDEVKGIMRFLKREVESLEKSGLLHTHTKSRPTVTQTTASSLVTVNAIEDACLFCKSIKHKAKDCDSNISIVEKRNLLRNTGRCFRCARRGHSSKKCRSGKFLACSKCSGKHMTSMCDPQYKNSIEGSGRKEREENGTVADSQAKNSAMNLCAHNVKTNVFLKTVRCVVSAPNKNISIRAVIDGGSQHTYIRQSVANKLNLKAIGTVELSVIPFGSKEANPIEKFVKVKLHLKNSLSLDTVISVEAVIVPEICVDVLEVPESDCPLFEGIRLSDVPSTLMEEEEGLSLLIGSDFYWSVVTGNQRHLTKRLRAIETVFGWALQGVHLSVSDSSFASNENSYYNSSSLLSLSTIHADLTQFWSLEAIGIKSNEDENHELTENLIERCITRDGSRYVASLPWKADSILNDNKGQAVQRLNTLFRRLSREPERLFEYDAAMRQLIKDGIAEPIDLNRHRSRVFYIPHRPVYKEESTTKLRVVFDASSQTDGSGSLNDHLWAGANLLPDVLKILLNFRLGRIGIVADIQKAFLQIMLTAEDRDSHRFLWFESQIKSVTDRPRIAEYRMTRVTFGVNCSPFLLCATIKHLLKHEEMNFAKTCATLKDSIYMDDVVISVDDEDEGIRLCSETLAVLEGASMTLHKWNSNNVKIRDAMRGTHAPHRQKVLGLIWFIHSDELSVAMDSIESFLVASSSKGTKRHLLQTIARIFDPIGIFGPSIIKLKILFQSLWKKKISWDEVLTGDSLTEWNECVVSILELKDMTIPRATLPLPSHKGIVEIHIFADASTKAYGAVGFVRYIAPSGQISVSFLCAKNRVAPLKVDGSNELTLPKMELLAALVAARLHSYLQGCLKLSSVTYCLWTDSKIVLSWIQGNMQRWKPYVQNRVDEIRRLTDISQWSHCKGKENPADLLTRGISGHTLRNSSLWAHGPQWLSENYINSVANEQLEPTAVLLALLDGPAASTNITKEAELVSYENYSSWNRLVRVTAYIYRFVRLTKRRQSRISSETEAKHPHLTASEIENAENHWVRYVQKRNVFNELCLLQEGRVVTKSSKICELSPFLDNNGIIRLGGRLQSSNEPMVVKHPIILPVKSHIVNLVVDEYHQRTLHAGVNIVLTQLRKHFWIIKGRQLVKKRIKACKVCRKLCGLPASQPFAPLPVERVTLSRPFDSVGVDFAGPLYCYNERSAASKIYVAIFTCAAVRAVHLELTRSLSTEHFIMALRRFISRRGVPSTIFSDNARTFRRAAIELRSPDSLWDEEVIQGFLSRRKIKWRFIVERAPWWGGFWERLIRTMKNLLKVTIGKAKLNFEQLRTIIVETEEIINSRPLTYVSADPLDLSPLTPSSFLYESRSLPVHSSPREPDADMLRSAWKQRMRYVTMLKKRWRLEYLQLLRSFHYKPNKSSIELKEGDVVLVADQSTPRINWQMAIVEVAFLGRDQRVRSCQIRLPDGKQFRRPVQLLYPLELQLCRAEDVEN